MSIYSSWNRNPEKIVVALLIESLVDWNFGIVFNQHYARLVCNCSCSSWSSCSCSLNAGFCAGGPWGMEAAWNSKALTTVTRDHLAWYILYLSYQAVAIKASNEIAVALQLGLPVGNWTGNSFLFNVCFIQFHPMMNLVEVKKKSWFAAEEIWRVL